MTHPQQPELHRSNKGETTQDAREARAAERDTDTPSESGNTGPTPPANQTEDERRSG
jgi:hypothetical protein